MLEGLSLAEDFEFECAVVVVDVDAAVEWI